MTVTHDDVVRWIRAFADAIAENKDYLTRARLRDRRRRPRHQHEPRDDRPSMAKLDGVDGDDVGALLQDRRDDAVSTVGGAGGPLYGTLFLQLGAATAGKGELTARGLGGDGRRRGRRRAVARQGRAAATRRWWTP